MTTIVEPKQYIDQLWGKQRIREDKTYRLMKYVLRVDHAGKVLLHNVVTGRLIVLDQEEAEILETIPMEYSSVMEQLVTEHYLVPEDYNEHQQVTNLRLILRRILDTRQKSALTLYTVLPTTACNARCYYCFERGVPGITMTEETADEVVRFIVTHCNGERVCLKWFGGEPTVASQRITQICEGLKAAGVSFYSTMTTNGYLFDEKMCVEAKLIWNLERVVFSMDGVNDHYNKIKDYIGAKDNPYERVLRNVGLLLDQSIHVSVRMNFDQTNDSEFEDLLSDVSKMYPPSPYLEVCAHYINDVQIVDGVERHHGTNGWYNRKILELHQKARAKGYLGSDTRLPHLDCHWCPAASPRSVLISPQGKLMSCYEFLGDEEEKGDLRQGITNEELDRSWRKFADVAECAECVLFPNCAKILKCKRNTDCFVKDETIFSAREAAIQRYRASNYSD